MPSVKPAVKNRTKMDGSSRIYIRIGHNHEVRDIPTIYYIDPKFMERTGKISIKYSGHNRLNGALQEILREYNNIIAGISQADIKTMPINTLVQKLEKQKGPGADFMEYTGKRILTLRKEGRLSLADLYETVQKHLDIFNSSQKLLFKEINPAFLRDFESWLRSTRSSSQNTVRNYMCNIRAIFNHAIDHDVIEQNIFPFRKYRIKQEKKQPRALDIKDMKRLLMAQPYLSSSERRDVDIFFLSFYLGGINLKDLLYLKHEDYYKGRIIYDRFKTGREYSIMVYPEAKEIMDRYPGEKYLLRFLENKIARTPADRKGYEHKDLLRNTNKYLKKAGEAVGLQLRLSTYVARYSFATIAGKLKISKDIIAQILGHGLNTITDLYIDFDQESADKALETVINSLKVNL